MSLEPIDPDTALELYLTDRANELADASLTAHEYRLGHFVRWCDQQDIENLNGLSGRQLHEYRLWRRDEGDLNKVSEKTQMDTLRVFIRWLESVDGVEQDLSEKVLSPEITPDENSRDVMLDTDRAQKVLTYCEKYAYASIEHVALSLMWHTMMRTGGVHALDVEDYHPDEQYLKVRHRPKTGTPIKNKDSGERFVALSEQLCGLLDDWLDTQRPQVTDEHGRNPLLATNKGRIHKGTLREYVYRFTRPCVYGTKCPHDRKPAECEAAQRANRAYACPSSRAPHNVRTGYITACRNAGVPPQAIAHRCDVSPRVQERHYDFPDPDDQRDRHKRAFETARDTPAGGYTNRDGD